MAQAGAVIDVVGAKQRAEKFLQEVVVFVGRLGATINRHRTGAVALVNLYHSIGGVIESLVTRNFPPLLTVKCLRAVAGLLHSLANLRRRHTIIAVNKVVAEPSFNAKVTVVDHRVKRRRDFVDVVIFDMEIERASHTAIRASRRDDTIGRDHDDFLRRLVPPRVAWTISSSDSPCSRSASRLGLSAPVGHTPTHWPQNTQAVSGMGLSKNVPMPVSKPRPLKLMA